MATKKSKLPLTPITEETFKRQGWIKYLAGEEDVIDEEHEPVYQGDDVDVDALPFFYTIPIPKDRIDRFAPMFVSNVSDELGTLKKMGLKPGQFFVELMDMDGLGLCTSEEELELLYKLLTGKSIE